MAIWLGELEQQIASGEEDSHRLLGSPLTIALLVRLLVFSASIDFYAMPTINSTRQRCLQNPDCNSSGSEQYASGCWGTAHQLQGCMLNAEVLFKACGNGIKKLIATEAFLHDQMSCHGRLSSAHSPDMQIIDG